MTDVEPLAPKGGLWSAPWTNLVVRALEDEPSQGALFRCEVVDGIVERGTVVLCALDDDQWERVDASPKPAPLGIGPATDEQIAAYEAGDEPWDSWADGIDALIARVRQEQDRANFAEAAASSDALDHLRAAEAERDRLRAEVDDLRTALSMEQDRATDDQTVIAGLERERNTLRAEVDRMRPVVGAAEHYEEITDVADATLLMGAARRLARAVRAYREGEA